MLALYREFVAVTLRRLRKAPVSERVPRELAEAFVARRFTMNDVHVLVSTHLENGQEREFQAGLYQDRAEHLSPPTEADRAGWELLVERIADESTPVFFLFLSLVRGTHWAGTVGSDGAITSLARWRHPRESEGVAS